MNREPPTLKRFRIWDGEVNAANFESQLPDGVDTITVEVGAPVVFTVVATWEGGQGDWLTVITMGPDNHHAGQTTVALDGKGLEQFIVITISAAASAGFAQIAALRSPVRIWLEDDMVEEQTLTFRRS